MSFLLAPIQAAIGLNLYSVFITPNAQVARSDTFVLELGLQAAHWSNYAFPLLDPQSVGIYSHSGMYPAPAIIFPPLPPTTFWRYVRQQVGGSPAPSDPAITSDGPWRWTGSAIQQPSIFDPSDVWAAAERTLTNYATGVLGSSVVGSTISILRGDDISFTVSGLGSLAGRTGEKVWFTAKDSVNDLDASALFQVSETSGLKVLNRSVGTANQGSLTVTDATTGVINVTLTAASSAVLPVRKLVPWDVQWRDGSNKIHTLAGGEFTIAGDVTRATA